VAHKHLMAQSAAFEKMPYCVMALVDAMKVTLGLKSRVAGTLLCVVSSLALGFPALAAQTPPPMIGATSNTATEGTMSKVYRAANTIIVTTMDGIEHAYHFSKDLVVHGGKGAGVDALEGLHEGTMVVVHYTASGTESTAAEVDVVGDEGLRVTEGAVTKIDRGRQQITVKYANGKTEVFRLTERAAAEASKDVAQAQTDGVKVLIYYKDEHGAKVAHFFKTVSP
jgi:hypothetical protein